VSSELAVVRSGSAQRSEATALARGVRPGPRRHAYERGHERPHAGAEMEPSFASSFGDVRVHTDPAAPPQQYEFIDETGARRQVSAVELATLRGQAQARVHSKLAEVKGNAAIHRTMHELFLEKIHGQPESLLDALSSPSSLIAIAVDMRADVMPPPAIIWGYATHYAELGEQALAEGNLGRAAAMLRLADSEYQDAIAEWNKYMDAIQEGGQRLVSDLEVVRDASFAIAITAAVVVAAPVVASGVAAVGATGVGATALTGVGTGVIGAGVGGGLRGGSDIVAQEAVHGKVDMGHAWQETRRGFKEGAVAGVSAGVAPGLARLAGVGAGGSSLTAQVGRRALAEGGAQAVGQMTGAAMEGKSAREVLESGAVGFGTGALTAPLGAAGQRLARAGRPALAKAVEIGGSGAVAGGTTLATGGSVDDAIRNATIAMATAGGLSTAQHPAPPTPAAPAANTPQARAAAFQARYPKVDASPSAMAALTETFTRTGSGGRSVTPRPGEYVPVLSRGAASELKTLVELSRRPEVVRIEVVPSTTAQRTPDLIVHERQPDGKIRPSRVEIRTLTGASRGYQPTGGGGATASATDDIVRAVREKALPVGGAQSQLTVPMADVGPGGTIAIHIPRGGADAQANVDAAMARLAPKLATTPYVHAVEFFLPGAGPPVRYAREVTGTYSRVTTSVRGTDG